MKTDESVANAATEKTSVCEVLLGWLDQAMPKPQLCGSVVLPDVDSAFVSRANDKLVVDEKIIESRY